MMKNIYIPYDVVKVDGRIGRIMDSREYSHDYIVLMTDPLEYKTCEAEDLEPIPITQDVLEKNGWEKLSEYIEVNTHLLCRDFDVATLYCEIYQHKNDDKISTLIYKGPEDYESKDLVFLKHVSNVHELQHLLFGLGIDTDMIL